MQTACAPPGKYPVTDAVRGETYRGLSVEDIFTRIYATEAWGKGSGAGSVPVHCLEWINFVRRFIREEQLHSVVDLGCGDWQFSPYIYHDLNVQYTGYDVVKLVIDENKKQWGDQGYVFEQLEFSSHVAEIRDADLYILKDVLQHWSSTRITNFLQEVLSSKLHLKAILICNCSEPEDWPEHDICDGGWRPLVAARLPLRAFQPEVLLRFTSLPNQKEVSVIRPNVSIHSIAELPPEQRYAHGGLDRTQCWERCRRRMNYPSLRRKLRPPLPTGTIAVHGLGL